MAKPSPAPAPIALVCEAIDPPREHFNYDDIDLFCRCTLCVKYFEAVLDFEFFLSVTEGHRWHCTCYLCGQKRKHHTTSLAESSRRDLYSELSYLTHAHPFAPPFLNWVLRIIRDATFKSESWWASHAQKRALSTWMVDWQRLYLSPPVIAASGFC